MKKILLMLIIASSFATAIYASFPVVNENAQEIDLTATKHVSLNANKAIHKSTSW